MSLTSLTKKESYEKNMQYDPEQNWKNPKGDQAESRIKITHHTKTIRQRTVQKHF